MSTHEEVRQRAIFLLAQEKCLRARFWWLGVGVALGVVVGVFLG